MFAKRDREWCDGVTVFLTTQEARDLTAKETGAKIVLRLKVAVGAALKEPPK